jgi:hypothetical protein
MDVTTLKRFRQNACNDPVAIQILGLVRAKDGPSPVAPSPRKPRFPLKPPRRRRKALPEKCPLGREKLRANLATLQSRRNSTVRRVFLRRTAKWIWHSMPSIRRVASDRKSTKPSGTNIASDAGLRSIFGRRARSLPKSGRKTSIRAKQLFGARNPNRHAPSG